MSKEIEEIKKRFRLLDRWTIILRKEPEHFGSATILPSKRKAVIYCWEGEEPNDYILHELFTLCNQRTPNENEWQENSGKN